MVEAVVKHLPMSTESPALHGEKPEKSPSFSPQKTPPRVRAWAVEVLFVHWDCSFRSGESRSEIKWAVGLEAATAPCCFSGRFCGKGPAHLQSPGTKQMVLPVLCGGAGMGKWWEKSGLFAVLTWF